MQKWSLHISVLGYEAWARIGQTALGRQIWQHHRALHEIVTKSLIFHECLSVISLSRPAYLSKCLSNKKEKILKKPKS